MSITLNSGSGGASLLTDQVSGVDAQVVKLGYSASGTAPTQVSLTNPLPVQTVPTLATSGGASYVTLIAPATVAVETAKSSAGNVYGIIAFNLLSTPVYLKMFDAASITLGTTSANYQFMIPGNTGGAGFVIQLPVPRSHATSIKYAVSNGIALNDNTAITANSVIVDISYN
jgi:hypothetical protein